MSMAFSRQECWSGYPFHSPGIFPAQGLNLSLLRCRQIFTFWATREAQCSAAPWKSHFLKVAWRTWLWVAQMGTVNSSRLEWNILGLESLCVSLPGLLWHSATNRAFCWLKQKKLIILTFLEARSPKSRDEQVLAPLKVLVKVCLVSPPGHTSACSCITLVFYSLLLPACFFVDFPFSKNTSHAGIGAHSTAGWPHLS